MKDFRALLKYCIPVTILVGGIWLMLLITALSSDSLIAKLGLIGDSFGVLTSWASVLGFIGLIYTIWQQKISIDQQSKTIDNQKQAIELQIEEMKLDRLELVEQTEQFKKTYQMERRARIVAARPYFVGEDMSYYVKRKTTNGKTHIILHLDFWNCGSAIREVKFKPIEVLSSRHGKTEHALVSRRDYADTITPLITGKERKTNSNEVDLAYGMDQSVLQVLDVSLIDELHVGMSYMDVMGYTRDLNLILKPKTTHPSNIPHEIAYYYLANHHFHDGLNNSDQDVLSTPRN